MKILTTRLPKRVSDLDFRFLLLVIVCITFITYVLISGSYFSSPYPFLSLPNFVQFEFLFGGRSAGGGGGSVYPDDRAGSGLNSSGDGRVVLSPLNRSRIAVCLVGGARRFELTGPSIVERILKVYENCDLFLNTPLDSNSYKLFLLNEAPRIAAVRIFRQKHITQTESEFRVLTSDGSPNGIQGLLQYFSLVEGCLTLIKSHQEKNNFTYDWIIRTRVDGYWSDPLGPESFIPGKYTVPVGSSYGGLNDRFGVGDYNTSVVALSRLSSVSVLDSAGMTGLNSEGAFKAQFSTQRVEFATARLPFCIVTDRTYGFPPSRFGVPVAAMSSRGPLNGAKCRPCAVACGGSCVGKVMNGLSRWWSWTEWERNGLELCDARGEWENGWEKLFDEMAGENLAAKRKRVLDLNMGQCVKEFKIMKKRSAHWDGPSVKAICGLGLNVGKGQGRTNVKRKLGL